MRKLLSLCSIVFFALFPPVCCLAEGSKDMYPSGASGNRAYMTSSSTSTSSLIGNIINPGRMFVYAKAGEVIYIGSSAQGIGAGTTRLVAPNGTVYATGASVITGRINSRAEELAGPAALTAGGYNAYNRTVLAAEEGIWTVEFTSPNPTAALGTGFSPPAASGNWTTANQTAVSTLALIVAWDITVASAGVQKPGRVYLNIFTGNAGTANSAFYGNFNVLTKDGFTYTAAGNGIQPFLFAFFVNNKGTRDRATGVPVYKSVDLAQVISAGGAYSFHNPTSPDDATNITQKMFYNPPDVLLPAAAPVWGSGSQSSTWLINTPINPTVTDVSFVGKEGTPGQSGTPPLAGGYVLFTANQNGNFKISIDVNNNGSTSDPIDRTITGSSVSGANKVFWDGKDGLGGDVANGAIINISVVLFSGEVHFPYMDVENNVNGIIITRTNGSNAPNPTVYWNDELLGTGTGAPVPVNASANPGINSTTNGHKYTNSYGDNSLLDTWAYIFSTPIVTSVKVRQLQADLQVVINNPSVAAICVGSRLSFTTSIRNNGPDTALGAKFNFSFPAALTGVTVTPTITGTATIVSGGVSGNAYSATVNMNNGAVITYVISGTVSAVPTGGNLNTKSSILRPADVTDPDATNATSTAPTDPDVECNGAPSGAGCNNILTSSVTVSPTIGSNLVTAEQSICLGNAPAQLTGTTIAGTPVYLWQQSTSSATGGFAAASGVSNGKDYTPPVIPVSTWFRRVVTAGSCSDTSQAIKITVNPVLTPGVITGNQVFCGSGNPVVFGESVAPGGGTGTYTYRWQSSTDNINFADISGATQQLYDAPVLSQSTWFRRVVSSTGSGCAEVITDTVAVKIDAQPTVAEAGPDQQLCNVNATTLAATAPIVGTGSWSQGSGPNTAVFANAALNNTGVSNLVPGSYTFIWATKNGSCTGYTDTVHVNISAPAPAANAGPDQQLCNVNATTLAGNTATPGTGTWTQIAGPNTATIVNPAQGNTALQNLVPGTYRLVWTINSGACGTSADTVQLILSAPPTTANAGPDQTKYNAGQFVMGANTPANGTGAWALVSGSGTIADPAGPNTTITLPSNTTGTFTWTITNGSCPPSIDTVVLNYTRQADLKIIKSDAGSTYKTGSPLTYTLTVENLGPTDAFNFGIQDVLPVEMENPSWTAAVTGVGVSVNPVSGSGRLVKMTANMPFAAGNKIVVTITGTVAATTKGGDVISNQAGVPFPVNTPDPNQGNNTSTVTGIVPNNPPVAADDNYTTPRDVAVSGNVLDNDSDPEGQPLTVSPTLITPPAHGTVTQNANGTFTYTPASGFTGTDTYVYQVCDNQGACSTATVTITVLPPAIDLAIAKTATPATAVAGQPLTYTITLTNNGPSTVQPGEIISLKDSLPAGFIGASYTPSEGAYAAASQQWTGLTLTPGKSVTLTINGTVTSQFAGTSLRNVVYVTPPAGTSNPSTDSAVVVTPVNKAVEMTVEKTDNTPLYTPGTTTQYRITVINKGPSDLAGGTFRDPLPAGITVAEWTAVSPDGSQPAISGNGAIDQPLNMPAGSRIVYTLTLTIPSGFTGQLVNTATVTVPSGYTNINPAANTATDTDDADPQYNIIAVKTGPAREVAGDNITYQLEISNSGPSNLVNAAVADILPSTIQNPTWTVAVTGSATSSVTNGSGNVNFTANIPAGGTSKVLVTISGKISSAAVGSLVNTAAVTPPGKTTVHSNTVTTVLENKSGLTITKDGPASGTVTAGSSISYLITLTDAGPSDATNISLKDVVPAAIQNTSWTVTTLGTASLVPGAPASGTGNNIATFVNIPAGTANKVQVQINGTVNPAATDTLVNTATAQDTAIAVNKTAVINKPGLQIIKAGPPTADAGTTIVYTITVGNTGPSDAVNAAITDLAGLNSLSNVSWTATAGGAAVINSGASGTGNAVSVNANIPAGNNNKVTITITGTILPGASGSIRNTATVTVPGTPPVTSDEVTTTITNKPGLVITKQGPATGTAGGTIQYALKVTNTGPSNALSTILKDTIAAAVLNPQVEVQVFGKAEVLSRNVNNGIINVSADIPANDTSYLIIFVSGKINASFTGQIKNQAFITTSGGVTSGSEVVVTNVSSKPALVLTKSAADTAVAGQQLTYTITVANNGLSDATGAVINDAVPATLSNVQWSTAVTGSATVTNGATGNGNTVNITGNIPVGAGNTIQVTITGTVAPSFTGSITNYASGVAGTVPPVMSDTVVTQVVSKPQLQISKAGPASVSAGGFIQYTIEVTNAGPSDAANVSITDIVDNVVQHTDWAAAASGGAAITGPASGNTNNVQVTANIPVGSGKILITVRGTVDPAAAGTINNIATAGVTGEQPVTGSVATTVINNPQINLDKTGPAQLNAGEQISYRLIATNFGESDARNLKIQDIIPAQITNVSWAATVGNRGTILSGATGTGNNMEVTADLPAGTGNHIFIDITGTVAAGYEGVLTNYASAIMQAKDTVRSNTVNTTVANKPELQIVKSAPDTLAAGSNITFTLTVTNPGPSDAKNVSVTDAVAAFVQNVSWSVAASGTATTLTGQGTGNNILVTGTIPAGAGNMLTVTINGTIDPAFTGDIPNMATAVAGGQPPVTSNSTTTHVVKKVSLLVIKAGPDKNAAGDVINYLISVRNQGPSVATGVQFRDTVPAAIKNVSWRVLKFGTAVITAGATGTGNQIAVTADVPPGGDANNSILVIVEGTVDPAYTGASLTNVGYASSPEQLVPASDTAVTSIYSQSKLDIVKNGPTKAFAGDSITYTIHLVNNGPSNAANIVISDVIDPAILQPSWTAKVTGAATISGTSGTGNVSLTGNIPVGTGNVIDITVTGKLNPDFTGTSLQNTATAAIPGQQPVSASVNTTVARTAKLRVLKSGPANAIAGEQISYNITINNPGPSNVKGAVITDLIPAEITDPTWTITTSGPNTTASVDTGRGNLNFTADLPAITGSISVVIKGRVNPSAANGTNISNTVVVTPPADFEDNQPVSATVITAIRREADLVIVKSGPANRTAGQDITYQLLVTNRGISDVNNAVITDAVPGNIAITNATAIATGNASVTAPVVSGNNITLSADIAGGAGNSIIVTITGLIDPAATGSITNTATVTPPADVTETVPGNNTSSITTSINTDLGLQVSKSGPASVNVNDQITYTIVVTNTGISDAAGLTISDNIPADITGVTWNAVATGNADLTGAVSGTGNIINLSGRVGGSNSGQITIVVNGTVKTDAANTITNTVVATSGSSKSSTVVTTVNKSVDLRINKTAPATIFAGETISYLITVTNGGPADVMGATIIDVVPANITGVQWTATAADGASVATGSGSGNNISLNANIPAGTGTVTIRVTGIVDPAFTGTLTNTATATPPAGVTDPRPATVTVNTIVTASTGITIVKSGPATIRSGNGIAYTLEVRNNGPSAAVGVNITDTIPAAISNVSWSAVATNATITNPGTGSGSQVSVVADIPVNGVVRVTINGTTDPAFDGTVSNRAVAISGTDTTLSNTVDTRIENRPELSISKTGPATIAAGSGISYGIRIANSGPSTASGVVVGDVLPSFIQNAEWSATAAGGAVITGGNISNSSGNVNFKADIPAGGSILVNVEGKVDPAATGTLTNIAAVRPVSGEQLTDTVNTQILNVSGIRLVKAGPDSAAAGTMITYTIDVYNDGPSDAINAQISDVLPAQLQQATWSATAAGAASINGGNLQNKTGNVTFSGNIPVGAGNVIHIAVTGILQASFTGIVSNVATATTNGNTVTSNDVTTQVYGKPGIRLIKSGPAAAVAGGPLSYSLVLSNTGPSDAANITVNDVLPPQLQNATWSATAFGAAAITNGNVSNRPGNVNFIASVPAGADNRIVITVDGTTDPAFTGNVTNMATYNFNGVDVNTPQVITTITAAASLKLTKSAPDTLAAGNNIVYTLLVVNNGPSVAANVTIRDVVPATVQNATWTAVATGATINGSSSGSGNNISVNANIPPGAGHNILVTISGTIARNAAGVLVNHAAADFNGIVAAEDSASTQIVQRPGVLFTKSGPSKAAAGSNIVYTLDLTNAGPSDLLNALVTDIVPAQVEQVTWKITPQGGATLQAGTPVTGSGNRINFTANVPAGASNGVQVTITGVINPDFTGTILNEGKVRDANGNEYTSSVSTLINKQTGLSIIKTGPSQVDAGGAISYVITAANQGPSNATGISITDLVPSTITRVTWEARGSGNAVITGATTGTGNNIVVKGNVPAGAGNNIRILINGFVSPGGVANGISNSALLTTPEGVTLPSDTVHTNVSKVTAMGIRKVAPGQLSAGDSIQYTIQVSDLGTGDIGNVVIHDQVPASITGVRWTATVSGSAQITGGASGTGSNVTVTGAIPAGAGNLINITITGRVSPAFSGTVTNTATATAEGKSFETAATTNVTRALDLAVTKSGPSALASGDNIAYIITARNNGAAAGDGAVITDALPPGIDNITAAVLSTSGGAADVQVSISNRTVRAIAGVFPAGAVIRLGINGVVPDPGRLVNVAGITAPDGATETDPGNNTTPGVVTNVEQKVLLKVADVQLKKELLNNTPLQTGGKAEFLVTLTNAGPDTALTIEVRDTLKNNLDVLGGIETSAGTTKYDPVTRIVIWQVPQLALNQNATMKITARINNSGTVVNSASATGPVKDPDLANNSATTREVNIEGDDVFIPNVITPNGDGKNDKFMIIGISRYPNSSLLIYNRWGNQVYQSKNYQNEWDGHGLSEGTYYYVLKLRTADGERSYKGWIQLLR